MSKKTFCFLIFLRFSHFHISSQPSSCLPLLSLPPFNARTISGNQPLTSPCNYPVIPGAHTFPLLCSLAHTRRNAHKHKHTKDKVQFAVFPPQTRLTSFLSKVAEGRREGFYYYFWYCFRRWGQISFQRCPGTVRGRLGLIWVLIPTAFPWDPGTNLM